MVREEDWLLAAWKEKGVEPPASYLEAIEEGLEDEPELDMLEMEYLAMFHRASTCRPPAFSGVAPIPHLAVLAVLDAHGWEGSEAITAAYLIEAMDSHLTEHHNHASNASSR